MSEMMQIKVTIPGGFIHEGVKYSENDVSTETYELGSYFVRAGWAEDTSDTFKVDKPKLTDTILMVDSIISTTDTPKVF